MTSLSENSTLNYHSWQLSIIEKENLNITQTKFDKAEIALNFNLKDSNNESTSNALIKLNYFEFLEVYENLKKIDNQLQVFK